MKTPSTKIEAAVSKEQSRYTLNAVKLDVEHGRILATDGHILASVPAEFEPGDMSGLVPVDAIKAARATTRAQKVAPADIRIEAERVKVTGLNTMTEFERPAGNFPNVDAVFPKRGEHKYFGQPTITLDVDLLVRLADALGAKADKNHAATISLWVKDRSSAVAVRADNGPAGAIGMIMPIRGEWSASGYAAPEPAKAEQPAELEEVTA
jgi:hypothetical protein